MRAAGVVLVTILAAYVVFAAFAWLMADRMMFLPPPPSYRPGELPVVHVETEDGARIATVHLPNDSAAITLLYSHGNAEDLGHLAPILGELRALGFAVLAYDYRGYGLSSDERPTAAAAVKDAEAVYRYAVATLRIDPRRLVLYGRSIGSGPATALAARMPIGGLVIESGFTSAFRVMTRYSLLPFDRFPNERLLADVSAPVLVMHGADDEVIGAWHGRALFTAARAPKFALWVEGARHNDFSDVAGERYVGALQDFARVVSAR